MSLLHAIDNDSAADRHAGASDRSRLTRRAGTVMHEAQRYRYNAAECLRASQQARDDFHRKVRRSMAVSWLSLARGEEAATTPTVSRAAASFGANVPLPVAAEIASLAK